MNTPTRRQFLGTVGAGTTAIAWSGTFAAEAQRPNIVYVMSDDHAAAAVGAYGGALAKLNPTPCLDRLARQGMRFTNAFCTNSICSPARATLLTGKYSHLHGRRVNGGKFNTGQVMFPALLQQAGYQTALVGKWHLDCTPVGFDYWSVLPGQGVYVNPDFIEMGQQIKTQGYVSDIITDKALAFLKARDVRRPFCLLYHTNAPHRPWEPDEKHARMFEDVSIPEPPTFNDDYATRGQAMRQQKLTIERDLNAQDVKAKPPAGLAGQKLKDWSYQRFMKDYLRSAASMDENVGRLLDYLDREGLADNTLVVYTSDNGFFLGEHGLYDKRFMYEPALRVPLLVRWPGHVRAGAIDAGMVLNVDYAPTLLDTAGLAAPADMQGRSLRPLLEGRAPTDWRKSMYYRYYEPAYGVQPHYGVRTERYKLIHYNRIGEWELFDLQADPQELRNVYGDAGYAEVLAKMKVELDRLRAELKDAEP